MKNFKFMKPYPLYKVEYEQIPKGNSKSDVYRLFVKIAEPMNWTLLYVTCSSAWAEIALKRIQDIFDTQIIHFLVDDDEHFSMFEVHDQIYKLEYAFPEQSCVCGSQIAGNQRYGEFSVDYEKFDYIHEYVFFYEKGTALVKGNQLFIDGNLIFNSKDLKTKCDEIGQEFNKLDLYPEKLIQCIKKEYPDVHEYVCDTYSSHNI